MPITIIDLTGANNTFQVTASGRFRINALAGNDLVTVAPGTDGDDQLFGGDGDDRLVAAGSNDLLDGGAGRDTLEGGAGDDVLRGGAGADSLIGGDGIDTADYATSGAAVFVTLSADPNRAARGSGGDATGDTLIGIENLTGSQHNDVLTGNRLDNRLIGGLGNDVLRGLDGNDDLFGDALADADGDGVPDDADADGVPDGVNAPAGGNDLLDGGFGDDRMWGGGGNDTLIGGFGADALHGGVGDDFLSAGDGADLLDGGEGDDDLFGGAGDDVLLGGGGADVLNAASGNDELRGGDGADDLNAGEGADSLFGDAGDDTLMGLGGDDQLSGGEGDDILDGGTGADALDGGAGRDTADYRSATGPVGIDLGSGLTSGAAAGDILVSIENLTGSAFADILAGDGEDNLLEGGGGADTLVGQAGFDTASYSRSATGVLIQLNSSVADPTAVGTGVGGDAEGDRLQLVERVIGSAFADTLIGGGLSDTFVGGGGGDFIEGGDGSDTAEYSTSAAAVVVSLAGGPGQGGDAEGDLLSGIENLIGSSFADTLTGDGGANRLDGGAGDDRLAGLGGADRIIGGAGVDTADYSASLAAVSVGLVASDDPNVVTTGAGGDAAGDLLSGIESLVGSAFADVLLGSTAANRLEGGAGNDSLRGGAGSDSLIGGDGVDTALYSTSAVGVRAALDGSAGVGGDAEGDILSGIENLVGSAFADILIGDGGANQLQGGTGDDRLVGGAGGDTLVGGDGIDTIDYAASNAGITVTLTANPASATVGAGGHAAGDVINTVENVVGSAFSDTINGSAGANRLVSGAATADAAEVLRGGSGADLLIGNGAGQRTLFGDSVTDGGVAGQDTYWSLAGTNFIDGYQFGEDIFVNSAFQARAVAVGPSTGPQRWGLLLDGTLSDTIVLLGARTSQNPDTVTVQQINFILANDVFVDATLIA